MEWVLPLLFQMIIGHAMADFVLQPDAMGFGKNRNNDAQRTKGALFPHWYYWMTAHALVHAGAVYLLTANAIIGLIEFVLHWIIDFSKCEGWFNVHVDQALHIVCKISYCGLIYYGLLDASLLNA
jgi:hypothetical protein